MNLFGDEEEVLDNAEGMDAAAEPTVSLLPPKENDLCLGHERNEDEILKLFNSGKMPHALVFAGAEGIGKFTFAYRTARFLLSQELEDPNQDALFGPEPSEPPKDMNVGVDHPVFRRVAAGGHSDFFTIGRLFDEGKGQYKGGVEIAEVRKVAPFLRMTAAEGGWRVVIVNDADTMNRASQNGILKILEEPPKNTLLILIAHRPGALIPTIRSRARVMHFDPLGIDDMRSLLQKQGHHLAQDELHALYTLSEGSIGRALDLIDQGGLDVMGRVISMFEDYPSWKWSQLHVVAEDYARANNATSFAMFQNVMQWIARQMAVCKARGQSLPAGPMSALPQFSELVQKSPLERLLEICDNLNEHFEKVNRGNLEKRQAVLKAFSIFTG